jgi:pyrroline-5-carboxylate reductase
MSPRWPTSLVLVGAGKMGGAMLRGWLDGGLAAPAVAVVDPHLSDDMRGFCETRGIALDAPPSPPEVLVLAMKPQTFAQAPGAFASLAGQGTLVVSILAGKTLANLRAGLPHAGAIVRAMPNLPASVGRGATGVAGEAGLSPERHAVAQVLLEANGLVEWCDEALIDAVTGVSGSGPAYVFLLAECLAEAGVAAGLSPDVAARLARATVEGAGELMARQPDMTPTQLREAVTSPGGTTAAALEVLRGPGGMKPLLEKAVAAAQKRAGELAG